MLSVAPFGKHIWCRASPLREEDITRGPGLITRHEGIVQTQIAHYMSLCRGISPHLDILRCKPAH